MPVRGRDGNLNRFADNFREEGHFKSIWVTRKDHPEKENCINKSMQMGKYLVCVIWSLHLHLSKL